MFYCLDENKNLVEAFDKQGVLNAIETAIKDGSLANLVADAAFIDKLRCCVTGGTNRVAFVTQAKYNELVATNGIVENCLYFITDDTSVDDLNEILESINQDLEELYTKLTGAIRLKELWTGSVMIYKSTSSGAKEKTFDGLNWSSIANKKLAIDIEWSTIGEYEKKTLFVEADEAEVTVRDGMQLNVTSLSAGFATREFKLYSNNDGVAVGMNLSKYYALGSSSTFFENPTITKISEVY